MAPAYRQSWGNCRVAAQALAPESITLRLATAVRFCMSAPVQRKLVIYCDSAQSARFLKKVAVQPVL